MRHSELILCALLSAAGISAGIAGTQAGQVQNLTGTATVERGDQRLPLKRDDAVAAGDTIQTAAGSSAQFRLEDDAYIALTQNTEFRIDQFVLPEKTTAGKPGKSLMTLKQGGFHTITGLIGKSPRDAYEVVTPVAKLNEIGTDYEVFYCKGNCSGLPDGLYLKVNHGIVSVVSGGGHYVAHTGETVYVANTSALAVRVNTGPFDNPRIQADFSMNSGGGINGKPPRVEHEPPPSPS